MSRLHQFLLAAAFIAVLDSGLKTGPAIIQRDLLWTAIVFAGIAIWDHFVEHPGENQSPDAL